VHLVDYSIFALLTLPCKFNGGSETDPIFSKKRVADTLTYGYLEMLGTLSKYKDGIELLEKFKIFTAFYHLSELRSREDLIKGIVDNLDYSMCALPTFRLDWKLMFFSVTVIPGLSCPRH
jgi:hypothetical protein